MKKIVIMLVCIFLLGGCKKNTGNTDISVDEKEQYTKVSVQFKTQVTNIEVAEDINKIYSLLNVDSFSALNDDKSKGWIYKLTFYNRDKEDIFILLSSNKIKYNGKMYTCDDIDLEQLDRITKIIRK